VFQGSADERFRGDDGSADPSAAAALAAFAAARGSEHDALTALAVARLLVPVVAVLTAADEPTGPDTAAHQTGAHQTGGDRACAPPVTGEKASEMALPTLVGRDGRPAIPAFTCVAALARWQPAARPIPAAAARVWQAAVADSCAVIIDVAGPVPLAVEGARLAALASGAPVPLPHEDPDVRDAVAAAVAEAVAAAGLAPAPGGGYTLRAGADGSDLVIELAPRGELDRAAAESLASRVGSAVLDRLGARLRRGIAIAVAG
jgi:hypothetical protein